MQITKTQYIWASLRIGLGLIFLWAFLDKLFGLGFATSSDKSWLNGTSPTAGFLEHGTSGPFAGIFQSIAGSPIADWLFMLGLGLGGLALILGIVVKLASYELSLIMFLIWLCALPPEHHPFLDEHIIYILVLIGLTTVPSGNWIGFGKWRSETDLVKRYTVLK